MLKVEERGDVRHLTLSRPERLNALDTQLIEALTIALQDAAATPRLRAIVLSGDGSAFCAGADVGWMREQADATESQNQADARKLARLMRTLDTLPIPSIAAVHGLAYGGGVGIVACCDIALASEDARFGLTEVRLGLLPAVISPYVIAAMGPRQARRWFTTGETFDARRAMTLGLVHDCVPTGGLGDAVDNQLTLIHQAAPGACAQAKDLVRQMLCTPDALTQDRFNSDRIAALRAGAEGREGLDAFLNRRRPAWDPAH